MDEDNNGGNNPVVRTRVAILFQSPDFLTRTAILGGYIFFCNNLTMQEFLGRQLFGLPGFYRDSVRAIRPGLPLFLFNYETRIFYGIFEATSFGGVDIDPTAWPDRSIPGRSSCLPAQVRVRRRIMCPPQGVEIARHLLINVGRIRVELTVPEAINLLDIFSANIN